MNLKKKKYKDLENNIKSRETVLKLNNEIYLRWDLIEELFELKRLFAKAKNSKSSQQGVENGN